MLCFSSQPQVYCNFIADQANYLLLRLLAQETHLLSVSGWSLQIVDNWEWFWHSHNNLPWIDSTNIPDIIIICIMCLHVHVDVQRVCNLCTAWVFFLWSGTLGHGHEELEEEEEQLLCWLIVKCAQQKPQAKFRVQWSSFELWMHLSLWGARRPPHAFVEIMQFGMHII